VHRAAMEEVTGYEYGHPVSRQDKVRRAPRRQTRMQPKLRAQGVQRPAQEELGSVFFDDRPFRCRPAWVLTHPRPLGGTESHAVCPMES
jgi:hypothetical protein